MLRLTRKAGEGIVINEAIRIWIQKTSDGRCELAIDAPLEHRVRRCELPVETEELLQRTATYLGVPK